MAMKKDYDESTQQPSRQHGLSRREASPMSQWRDSPFSLMDRFADEIERIFENFGFGQGRLAPFGGRGPGRRAFAEGGMQSWSPSIEVFERGGQLVVRADLGGDRRDGTPRGRRPHGDRRRPARARRRAEAARPAGLRRPDGPGRRRVPRGHPARRRRLLARRLKRADGAPRGSRVPAAEAAPGSSRRIPPPRPPARRRRAPSGPGPGPPPARPADSRCG